MLLKRENGISLVELIVYAAILVVVIAAAYTIFDATYRAYDDSEGQAKAQEEARIAHASMTRHIRMAEKIELKQVPLSEQGYKIIIKTDINDDSKLDEIQYYLVPGGREGDRLYRVVNSGQPKFLVGGIRNKDIFNYLYDDDDENSRINKVEIKLIIDSNPDRLPGEYELKSQVTLRNYHS